MDSLTQLLFIEIFDDLLGDECVSFIDTLLLSVLLCVRRSHIPRVVGFCEDTMLEFSSEDVRRHFRMSKICLDGVMARLHESLIHMHEGGRPQIEPDKKVATFLWYLSNQESIRETCTVFGISESTAHGIIIEVAKMICSTMADVSKNLTWSWVIIYYIYDFNLNAMAAFTCMCHVCAHMHATDSACVYVHTCMCRFVILICIYNLHTNTYLNQINIMN